MAQLLIATEPGVFTMTDLPLAADQYGTAEDFIKISQNGKFAAVRAEAVNMGYYVNGDQPLGPVSPVDGSEFDSTELLWINIYVSSENATASTFEPGQLQFPALDPWRNGYPLTIPFCNDVDQTANTVIEEVYAFNKSNTDSQIFNYGVTLLICVMQRLSVQYQLAPGS